MNTNKSTCIFLLLILLSLFERLYAQAPQGIPYQAVARNSSGAILASTATSVRFTIRDSIATGTIKYRETFSLTTTAQGMFSVNVGQGTVVSGTFSGINWGNNSKFMQVEIDPAGGSSYIDMGTQQMMSVPYALYANFATVSNCGTATGFKHYIGENWGGGIVVSIYKDTGGEEHGLIVSVSNQSVSSEWSNVSTSIIGISAQSSWDGLSNSDAIVSQAGHTGSAAKYCLDYVTGGYDDWYLPSLDELNCLINNRFTINRSLSTVSGSEQMGASSDYWSSTEIGEYDAFCVDVVSGFGGDVGDGTNKGTLKYVRAVRKF